MPDNTPLPLAMRATEITQQDADKLFAIAENTDATSGRLTREPRRIGPTLADHKRELVILESATKNALAEYRSKMDEGHKAMIEYYRCHGEERAMRRQAYDAEGKANLKIQVIHPDETQ